MRTQGQSIKSPTKTLTTFENRLSKIPTELHPKSINTAPIFRGIFYV